MNFEILPLLLPGACVLTSLILIVAIWRRLTVPCGVCRKRLPPEFREHRVRCPYCGAWPLRSAESDYADFDAAPQSPSGPCARCNIDTGANGVRLWDEQSYCRQCVGDASPELLRAALQREPLIEVGSPRLSHERARAWFLGSLIIVVPFSGWLSLLAFAAGQPAQEVGGMFGVLLLLGLVPCAVRTAAGLVPGLLPAPVLEVSDGQFALFTGGLRVWPLADCRWREGLLRETLPWPLSRLPLLKRPVLFLTRATPTPDPSQIPVGFTDDTRRVWKAFFELAGVPALNRIPRRSAGAVRAS